MSYFKAIFFFSFCVLFSFTSCDSRQSSGDSPSLALQSFETEHTSRNSLDWAGTYRGNFPCDDCDAEEIIIKIKLNGNYIKTKRKIGKMEPVMISSGKFSWNEQGNEITLHEIPEESYLVGEGRLLMKNGKNNQSFLTAIEKDFLIKENFPITETYWKLIQLNQKPINLFEKEPHLIFKSKGSVKGFGACNPFTTKYELLDPGNILISDIDIQEKSCPADNTEQEFLKVLQSVKSYDVLGDILFFVDTSGHQIAKFEAVYLN